LTARLSERASIKVLLLEAGKDYTPGTEPAEILDILESCRLGVPVVNKSERIGDASRREQVAVGCVL
jgi:choline dehydrogenase-like flavoprotein